MGTTLDPCVVWGNGSFANLAFLIGLPFGLRWMAFMVRYNVPVGLFVQTTTACSANSLSTPREVQRLYHRNGVEPRTAFFALQADWWEYHGYGAEDRHNVSALGLPVAATLGDALDAMVVSICAARAQ